MNHKKVLTHIICFFVIISLSACGTFGSHMLPKNQHSFNLAATQSNDEQLLLNIVRLHFGDRPYFLRIESINSQFRFEPSLGVNFGYKREGLGVPPLFADGSNRLGYAETPTISYAPLQGSEFTHQILKPMSVLELYTLIRSGWSIARAFRVCVQKIADLENAQDSSRSTSSHAPLPEYKEFIDLSHYLRDLERTNELRISAKKIGDRIVLELYLKHQTSPKLMKWLGLKQPQKLLRIGEGYFDPSLRVIPIQLRSFLGVAYYLSKSVDTPAPDIKAGHVTVTREKDGKIFPWENVTRGVLKIYSSSQVPMNANIKVYYRGNWFFISDSDDNSKQTMSLITLIYAMQASEKNARGPVLTLPL